MSKKVNFVKTVLDTFAIQNNPEELSYALNHISTDDVIVFENALTKLKIGNHFVKDKMFDVVIFSEQSDIMILIDKFSPISKEEIFEELKTRNIDYHLVSFLKHESHHFKKKTPELWFARDPNIVSVACEDTKRKTKDLTYVFKREVESEMDFEFMTNSSGITTFANKIKFSGLIKFKDKVVLITTSNNIERKHEKISWILDKKGFTEVNSHTI